MHRQAIAILFGSISCSVLAALPAIGQEREEVTIDSGNNATATTDGSSTAVVQVVTEPAFSGGGTLVFTGAPAGKLLLTTSGQGSLTAGGIAAGSQVSKLSEIDKQVADAGYELTEIRCDDNESARASAGNLENRAAIFRIEDGEAVTCLFVLSKRDVGSIGSREECICPKEGRWNAQNLEGKMDCKGAFVLNRKLEPVRDNGVIFVMEDDCSSVFGDSMTKKEEDVLMTRVDGCGYAGTIDGEEEGIDMVIEITWTIENEEFIKGVMTSSTSQMGISCDLYRPFELTFDEALSEDQYQKWRKRIVKKLGEKK